MREISIAELGLESAAEIANRLTTGDTALDISFRLSAIIASRGNEWRAADERTSLHVERPLPRPKAALAWLERVFGFEITMAIDGPPEAPEMCHYEMSHEGRGRIMVGAEWTELVRSPASVGGANTQSFTSSLPSGLDEHCERARPRAPTIAAEPEDQFYGDRSTAPLDLEGSSLDVREHSPRGHAGRGRGRARPADHRHAVGVSGSRQLDDTLAALADPVRRGAVELLAATPAPRRRAGRRARRHALDDEQAPARAARARPRRRDPSRVRRTSPRSTPCARRRCAELRAWLDTAERGWAEQLAAFAAHLERQAMTSWFARARRRCACAATPARAFAAFTDEIGQWWRPNGLFQFTERPAGHARVRARRPDGRLVETLPRRRLVRDRRDPRLGPAPPARALVAARQLRRRPGDRAARAVRRRSASRHASRSSTSAGTRSRSSTPPATASRSQPFQTALR